jgi:hypothetical protein
MEKGTAYFDNAVGSMHRMFMKSTTGDKDIKLFVLFHLSRKK